jgi:hypothetical protein
MSSDDFTLLCAAMPNIHTLFNTLSLKDLAFTKMRTSPGIHLFGIKENTVQILGLQHFKLMRKLHVRLAFMLTVTLNA